jgi:mono/diheme cytochrome c family protein
MSTFILLYLKSFILACLFLTVTSVTYANNVDDEIVAMSQHSSVTALGKKLFEQVCASCHAKDLSGESGFNLKDGEWIHGRQPSQIVNNIKKGFVNAGMPGFDAVYSDAQLQTIVAYILSKKEGFDGLTFKIYQMTDHKDSELNDSKLVEKGAILANFADFQLAEIDDYTIEFEGDFYAPTHKDARILIQQGKRYDINIFINGKLEPREGKRHSTWKLARGKQHLKVTYHTRKNKPHLRNISMIVTNDDMSRKLFPISVRARQIMANQQIDVIATSKTLVQRKKIANIPAYSIAVGLSSKINYAFNTRLCSIVALWQGDLLNVGPNVDGRGQDASSPLGDWVFNSPKVLQQVKSDNDECHYKGYKLVQNEPVFTYQLGNNEYTLTAHASSDKEIQFNFQVNFQVKPTDQANIEFSFPQTDKLSWHSPYSKMKDDRMLITPDANGRFTISAQIH